MENEAIIEAAALLIEAELDRGFFAEGKESLANVLRCAAWEAIEGIPGITASLFGDAAATLDLHRQAAMNRFNEGKKNLALANGE